MDPVEQFKFLNKRRDTEAIECPDCGCNYFEDVEVARYSSASRASIGQGLAPFNGEPSFHLMRCIRCTKLVAPNVLADGRDLMSGPYHDFLDEIEGKGDRRKQVSDQMAQTLGNSSSEVSSEKL